MNSRPVGTSRGLDSRGDPLPPVPDASPFRRPPMVLGSDPDLLEAVDRLLYVAPELRGQLPSISQGHTGGSMRLHTRSGLPPDAFGESTLLGVTERGGAIGLHPGLRSNSLDRLGDMERGHLDETLGHEAAHAVGYGEGDAETLGLLMKRAPRKR